MVEQVEGHSKPELEFVWEGGNRAGESVIVVYPVQQRTVFKVNDLASTTQVAKGVESLGVKVRCLGFGAGSPPVVEQVEGDSKPELEFVREGGNGAGGSFIVVCAVQRRRVFKVNDLASTVHGRRGYQESRRQSSALGIRRWFAARG